MPSQKVVQFLMTSGVDVQALRAVWDIAARTSNDYLLKEEFYVALRLVAYLQNDIPANESTIRMNVKSPNPNFSEFCQGTPGAGTGPQPSRGAAAARGGIDLEALPSLDDMDFSSPQPMNPQIMSNPQM